MANVVKSQTVGNGMLFDGRQFRIVKLTHDRDIRGVGTESFALDIHGTNKVPGETYGFKSEEDVKRFLTSGDEQTFDAADDNGDTVQVKRQGLGIPEAIVHWA